jgi:hypothetical protein
MRGDRVNAAHFPAFSNCQLLKLWIPLQSAQTPRKTAATNRLAASPFEVFL